MNTLTRLDGRQAKRRKESVR